MRVATQRISGVGLLTCALAAIPACGMRATSTTQSSSLTTISQTPSSADAGSGDLHDSEGTTSVPESMEQITIAFGGDVHFEGLVGVRFADEGAAMFAPIAQILSSADIAIVNFESAITERGEPVAKAYNFRAPYSALAALGKAGVDLVSLANNHGLDYGDDGLVDTLAAKRKSPVAVIGIGATERDAYRAHKTFVKGQTVAFLAASHVIDGPLVADWTARGKHPGIASAYETERLLKAVRAARASSDTVVVYLHWGTEGSECPQDRQTTLATQLVEAGADIVVGAHAHRLQGAGRHGQAFVSYGLGNFIWYSHGGIGSITGVLTVKATGRQIDAYEFTPAVITDGVPTPLDDDRAKAAQVAWESLRGCTDLDV